MRPTAGAAALTFALVALVAGPALAATPGQVTTAREGRGDSEVVFRMSSDAITESSSLVVSTTEPNLVYTTNDSGDAANVYAVDTRSGDLVGTTSLSGVEPIDIEAMAGGSDGSLVIADIGDNDAVHPSVTVYRVPQPARGDFTVEADAVTLTYDGGPRDAEAVLYDADRGKVFVVSKDFAMSRVYETPRDVFSRATAVLEPVAPAASVATDATFLPSGDVVVLRTYLDAVFYSYPDWTELASRTLPLQRQGESVTAPDDTHLWIGSEGLNSEVLLVDVPDLTEPEEPTSTPTQTDGSPSSGTADESGGDHEVAARNVIVIAGGLLLVVIAIGFVRYHRHH